MEKGEEEDKFTQFVQMDHESIEDICLQINNHHALSPRSVSFSKVEWRLKVEGKPPWGVDARAPEKTNGKLAL
jgi:hypothetical protein